MTELVTQPNRFGQRSRAVTISDEWDLQRLGSELRLIRRSQKDIDRYLRPPSESSFHLISDNSTRQEWTVSVSHPDHISITAKARNHHDTETNSTLESYATSNTAEQVYFFSLIIAQQQPLLSYTLRYVNLAEDVCVTTTSTNDTENKKLLRKEKKVREILVDRKVPLHRRDRVLVLCAADDTGLANKGITIIAILVSSNQIIIADGFNPQTIYDDDLESHKIIEFLIRSSG